MAKATTQSRRTGENISESSSDVADDIRQLRDDVSRLMDDLKAMGEHSGPAVRKAAGDGIDQLRKQGGAAIDNVKGGAQELEHEMSRMIRERPFTSLVLAGGIGFLLALATKR